MTGESFARIKQGINGLGHFLLHFSLSDLQIESRPQRIALQVLFAKYGLFCVNMNLTLNDGKGFVCDSRIGVTIRLRDSTWRDIGGLVI